MHQILRSSVAALFLIGCAASDHLRKPAGTSPSEAVERFYSATTPEALRAAVRDALAASPRDGTANEIASLLAELDGRNADAVAHLFTSLSDVNYDSPISALDGVRTAELTAPQRRSFRAVLAALAKEHPREAVRSYASSRLANVQLYEGDLRESERSLANIPGRVSLAWVGPWDNDQGKAFDLVLGPEENRSLEATYTSRIGPLRWRRDVPTDSLGRSPLDSVISQSDWMVAYGQGSFTTSGPATLEITSSDPVKVWVDDKLVVSIPKLTNKNLRPLRIPLAVAAGPHTLFVKSAHGDRRDWLFSARVVPSEPGVSPLSSPSTTELLEAQLPATTPARRAYLLADLSRSTIGSGDATSAADAYLRATPKGVISQLSLVMALLDARESGRATNALQVLDQAFGDNFACVRALSAQNTLERKLSRTARSTLTTLIEKHPEARCAWSALTEVWQSEDWPEDALRTLDELDKRFGKTPETRLKRARYLSHIALSGEAEQTYREAVRELPGSRQILVPFAELTSSQGQLPEAEALWQRRLNLWPTDTNAWLRLAEVRRRRGDPSGARAALDKAEALMPVSPRPAEQRGTLAYQLGDKAAAIAAWREALARAPENERLANRLSFLDARETDTWAEDVPTRAAVAALAASPLKRAPPPGADATVLLDHSVTTVNSDGSSTDIITFVARALNDQGRDQLIRQSLAGGRVQVLEAYVLDAKGNRTEAATERGQSVLFRGLQPSATTVLQYRVDRPPRGYLPRYFSSGWKFEFPLQNVLESTLILYLPEDAKLHTSLRGKGIERRDDKRHGMQRIVWTSRDMTPILPEPGMPSLLEIVADLSFSTVPDWTTWLSWINSLLRDVYRDSPELDSVAADLSKGAASAREKFRRIQAYVMQNIRYQQDYEFFISGVKPHSASTTLERGYGDCKDKAVLFILLARKLGLDARFALVRTREMGPVEKEVPMQQFNHAIVYTPAQGDHTARFYDPTAELMDIDGLRSDEQGTLSLVVDPERGTHEWLPIPYLPPSDNRTLITLDMNLAANGSANGTVRFEATGDGASFIRREARNKEPFDRLGQQIIRQLVEDATGSDIEPLSVEDLRSPASFRMKFESPNFALSNDGTLRLPFPKMTDPRPRFALPKRRYPLVFGVPFQYTVELIAHLPPGFAVTKLPAEGKIELPCLRVEKKVQRKASEIRVSQTLTSLCERIPVDEYAHYRTKLEESASIFKDMPVIAPTGRK